MTAVAETPFVRDFEVPPPDPKYDQAIQELTETYRQRRAAVRTKIGIWSSLGAQIRCYLGYKTHVPNEEKKKMKEIADRVSKTVEILDSICKKYVSENGSTLTTDTISELRRDRGTATWFDEKIDALENVDEEDRNILKHWWLAALSKWISRSYIEKVEIDHCDKRIADLTKSLYPHVVEWINSDRCYGISLNGVGHIIAETGDLRNYSNPGKMWKRCGVAVIDGDAQGFPKGFWKDDEGNKHGSISEDTWIRHGHSGKRHATVWNVGECLIKSKDATKWYYRGVYESYRARDKMNHPEPVKNEKGYYDYTPLHMLNRAKRYALKKFLKDLWNVWCFGEVENREHVVTPERIMKEGAA